MSPAAKKKKNRSNVAPIPVFCTSEEEDAAFGGLTYSRPPRSKSIYEVKVSGGRLSRYSKVPPRVS